ncbi:Not1 N-terminal domain, CCR4-Not complex component-domain-containing protein [Blastocladiella britannica]|nr:Not1 N-terminal domain, CCR4-Not complex component-domain-containing protein [Blastocladiella britannica]
MAARKLQIEIDKTLKKVGEGVEEFKIMVQELNEAKTAAQREKIEGELKRDIKKLQRMRDQIKTWINLSDIKVKQPLLDTRRLIEVQMELFKEIEKDLKTKAFSKEGLLRPELIDPEVEKKEECVKWINDTVAELQVQIDAMEAQQEQIGASGKKGSKKSAATESVERLGRQIEAHRQHIRNLEIALRMIENSLLEVASIDEIKESVEFYISQTEDEVISDGGCGEVDDDQLYVYDDLGLDEDEELFNPTVIPVVPTPQKPTPAVIVAMSPKIGRIPTGPSSASTTPPTPAPASAAAPSSTFATFSEPVTPAPSAPPSTSATPRDLSTDPPSTPALTAPLPVPPPPPKLTAWNQKVKEKLVPSAASSSVVVAAAADDVAAAATSLPAAVAAAAASKAADSVVAARGRSRTESASSTSVSRVASPSPTPSARRTAPAAAPESDDSAKNTRRRVASTAATPVPPSVVPEPTAAAATTKQQQLSRTKTGSTGAASPTPTATKSVSSSKSSAPPPLAAAAATTTTAAATTARHTGTFASGIDEDAADAALLSDPRVPESLRDLLALFTGAKHAARTARQQPHAPALSPSSVPNGKSPTTPTQRPVDVASLLDATFLTAPLPMDVERYLAYSPAHPVTVPAYYPVQPLPIMDNPRLFERMDLDTMFYVFYYRQGSLAQYYAARELKRQSWRFHTRFQTWFQRHEEPKEITSEYEQGAYIYFDWEVGWCQRKKNDFKFEYRYLEDTDVV